MGWRGRKEERGWGESMSALSWKKKMISEREELNGGRYLGRKSSIRCCFRSFLLLRCFPPRRCFLLPPSLSQAGSPSHPFPPPPHFPLLGSPASPAALEEEEEVPCEGRDCSFSSQWRTTGAFQPLTLVLAHLLHPHNHHPQRDFLFGVLSVAQGDFC